MIRSHLTLLSLLAVAMLLLAAPQCLVAAQFGGPPGGGMRQTPPAPPPGGQMPGNAPLPGGPATRPGPDRGPVPGMTGPLGGIRQPPDEPRDPPSTSIVYRGTRYLISGGQWYTQRGEGLVAVTPPAGVLVKDLPAGYSMRWIGGAPYFYADGIYYVWRERQRRYEILQAPPTAESRPPQETRPDSDRERAATP